MTSFRRTDETTTWQLMNLKAQLAFGAAILALLVVGFISYRGMVVSSESQRWAQHTQIVLNQLTGLLLSMENIESSYRGFALTGEESNLTSYPADILASKHRETTLRTLTVDNPAQQLQMPNIERLVAEKTQFAEMVIGLRRAKGAQAAEDAIRDGPGAQTSKELRGVVHQLQQEELRLLALRNDDAKRRLRQTKTILMLGTILGLLISIAAAWSVQRESSRREFVEEALKDSEEKFRGLLEAAPDAMVVSQNGGIVLMNVQAENQFGYLREELLHKPIEILIPGIEHPINKNKDVISLRVGGGKAGQELFGLRKDGSEFSAEIMVSPLANAAGTLMTTAIRDTTVRKKSEEQLAQTAAKLQRSNEELQELKGQLEQRVTDRTSALELSNRLLQVETEEREKAEMELRQAQRLDAIGRLAGGVAHDFNNLLAIILGQSEILLEQSNVAASTHRLEMITESANRGAVLTRQLLAFARRQILETQTLDFNVILADVEKLLRLAIGAEIELEFKTESELGSIEADPGQLEQVILNLALNARDAMPAGGKLTIATTNLHLDEECLDHRVVIKRGHYVQVVVSDTGCGMDEQTQSRIFEPFFTTKGQNKGTGLGLATVYGIVKQSGGYIWVYSEPDHGTSFKIYLPMVRAAGELVRPVGRSKAPPTRGSETILVVEDDALLREVTCEFFHTSGYNVIPAGSADQALQLAKCHNGPVDFLLTDLIMPGMNGRELAIRLSEVRPEMKVLYVSGYADGIVQDGVHGPLGEGLAFLQKPYTRIALTRKVREILDA